MSIAPLYTNFSEILIEIQTFPFNKMHLKMSSAKLRPFWFGINVLSYMIHGACTKLEQMYGCYLYLNTGCARLRNVMIHFLHLWNVVFTYLSIIRSVCVWSRKTHFTLFCAVHAYFMLSPSVDREICVYISYFNWCWAIRRNVVSQLIIK